MRFWKLCSSEFSSLICSPLLLANFDFPTVRVHGRAKFPPYEAIFELYLLTEAFKGLLTFSCRKGDSVVRLESYFFLFDVTSFVES